MIIAGQVEHSEFYTTRGVDIKSSFFDDKYKHINNKHMPMTLDKIHGVKVDEEE